MASRSVARRGLNRAGTAQIRSERHRGRQRGGPGASTGEQSAELHRVERELRPAGPFGELAAGRAAEDQAERAPVPLGPVRDHVGDDPPTRV